MAARESDAEAFRKQLGAARLSVMGPLSAACMQTGRCAARRSGFLVRVGTGGEYSCGGTPTWRAYGDVCIGGHQFGSEFGPFRSRLLAFVPLHPPPPPLFSLILLLFVCIFSFMRRRGKS